ncbi:MAG: hypothetical protein ACREA0_19500, partial [bacterium]
SLADALMRMPGYVALAADGMDECGLTLLAGRSVGASFVGVAVSAGHRRSAAHARPRPAVRDHRRDAPDAGPLDRAPQSKSRAGSVESGVAVSRPQSRSGGFGR